VPFSPQIVSKSLMARASLIFIMLFFNLEQFKKIKGRSSLRVILGYDSLMVVVVCQYRNSLYLLVYQESKEQRLLWIVYCSIQYQTSCCSGYYNFCYSYTWQCPDREPCCFNIPDALLSSGGSKYR
jgi:hypothetical protein